MNKISNSLLNFLKELKNNNNREWFQAHKEQFQKEEALFKNFCEAVQTKLIETDQIEKMKVYRIYKDVRFSKDKTPYKTRRSVSFSRATEALRGGYHIHIEPRNCMIIGGFWQPNPEDLKRIRQEFEISTTEIEFITQNPSFKKLFGTLEGETVKTAPRGFDPKHPNIEWIRKKSFLAIRKITNKEAIPKFFEYSK